MKKMTFSIKEAREYANNNELERWIQSFLRDTQSKYSNPNIDLADGLLLEERFYIGPLLFDLDKIIPVRIEKHIFKENELVFYNKCVNMICNNYQEYNLPPLIIEYKDDNLYLSDGNHRYSALKKLGINKYYVIIWGNKDKEEKLKLKILDN